MASIKIPTPLRPYTKGNRVVEVSGSTVAEALSDLVQQYPELRQHIYNGDGALRPFVNIFLGDEEIRQLEGLETPLDADDTLMMIPSIAGG